MCWKWSWPILRIYEDIWLGARSRTTKILIQGIRCPNRSSKWSPSKSNSEGLIEIQTSRENSLKPVFSAANITQLSVFI